MTVPDNPHYRDLILDAAKPLTVLVAEEDRIADVRCSPSRCVGANALRRLPGVLDARVGNGSARILRKDGWRRYDLDPDTRAARHAYDEAAEKMPVGFRFKLIPPKKPLGARRGETPGTDKRSGARRSVATRQPSDRSLFVEPPDA